MIPIQSSVLVYATSISKASGVIELSRPAVYRLRELLEDLNFDYPARVVGVERHLGACIHPANVRITISAGALYKLSRARGGRNEGGGMI